MPVKTTWAGENTWKIDASDSIIADRKVNIY